MSVTLQLTDKCSLNCSYCFEGPKGNSTITFEQGQKAVDFILENHLQHNRDKKLELLLYGGEVFLEYALFLAIFDYAQLRSDALGVDVKYSLVTNGYSLTDEQIEFLALHKDKFSLKISLDGQAATHDRHRQTIGGEPSFAKVLSNAKKLCSIVDDLTVMAVVIPAEVPYFFDNINYLIKEGFTKIEFAFDYLSDWKEEDLEELENQLQLLSDIYIQVIKMGKNLRLLNFEQWAVTAMMNRTNGFYCYAGKDSYYINLDGKIYSCAIGDRSELCAFGDVQNGFSQGVEVAERLELAQYPTDCQECPLQPKCLMSCFAWNLRLTGSIYDVSPILCVMSQLYYKYGTLFANRLFKEAPEQFKKRYQSQMKKTTGQGGVA